MHPWVPCFNFMRPFLAVIRYASYLKPGPMTPAQSGDTHPIKEDNANHAL